MSCGAGWRVRSGGSAGWCRRESSGWYWRKCGCRCGRRCRRKRGRCGKCWRGRGCGRRRWRVGTRREVECNHDRGSRVHPCDNLNISGRDNAGIVAVIGVLQMPIHSCLRRKVSRREVQRRIGEILGVVGAVFAEGKDIGFGLAGGYIPIYAHRVAGGEVSPCGGAGSGACDLGGGGGRFGNRIIAKACRCNQRHRRRNRKRGKRIPAQDAAQSRAYMVAQRCHARECMAYARLCQG